MTRRKFRWGILGVGKIAQHFANDLALINDAELYAVASRSQGRADEFAQRNGASFAYDDYEKLIAADVDAIYIATRHPQHCDLTIKCLNAEKPVLCEKPLAINARQVTQMTAAARANRTFLMEAIWTNFMPTHQRVFDFVEAGVIGEVIGVKADFGFAAEVNETSRLWNKDLGGGALLDIGIYPLFLAQKILGKPKDIQAAAVMSSTGVDAETVMTLIYEDKKLAQLHASFRSTTDNVAYVYGTKGTIKIHPRWHESLSFEVNLNNGEEQIFSFDFKNGRGYRFEIQHVMNCLKSGAKESPLLPLQFSEDLIRTADAVRQLIGLEYPEDRE